MAKLKDFIGGVVPAIASGALGDENKGFALGVVPGLIYRNKQRKKDAAGNELPEEQQMKKGGKVKSSASKRGDGIAQRGKTRGKFV